MGAPGGQKTGGRQKGTPNKSTQEVANRLAELGCDPLELSAKIALGQELDGPHPSVKEFRELVLDIEKAIEGKVDINTLPDRLTALIDEHLMAGYVPMELRSKHVADLMQYRHPKRKAVEVTGKDGDDLMPTIDPEKLDEATLRALVAAMTAGGGTKE